MSRCFSRDPFFKKEAFIHVGSLYSRREPLFKMVAFVLVDSPATVTEIFYSSRRPLFQKLAFAPVGGLYF